MTSIAVTGGAGYIGSALLPLLQTDDDVERVILLDNLSSGSRANLEAVTLADDIDFRVGDVREYGDVEGVISEVDTVIHLAAITGASSTHERREETMAVNLEATENVVAAAEKHDLDTVVFASSCNIYGRATSTDITEHVDPDPLSPYAESKYEGEQLVVERAEAAGMNGIGLRMATNYGYAPGIRFNLVVNYFVFRALIGRPLTVYGDGTNWRPFIHVRDAAAAFKHAAINPEQWSQRVYNVGSSEGNYQVGKIAEIVREEVGPIEITYLEDENPGPSYHVNFDQLSSTGFAPEWTLREGIRDLADRFRESDRQAFSSKDEA